MTYLVQLLDDKNFIFPHESLNILNLLLFKSTHSRTRYGFSTKYAEYAFEHFCPGETRSGEQICQSLRTLILIVGRLNRRFEIQEKDWAAFGQERRIPLAEDKESKTPLLHLLLDYATELSLPEVVRRELVILPTYGLGKPAYRRWVALLLLQYSVEGWTV